MSWAEELSKVYELATSAGSYIDGDSPLLPVAHSTANAQITVTLNADGTIPETGFAQAIPKAEQTTVIPVTEDSGTRTAGIAPHPLADKLIYIAGDYPLYANAKPDNSKHFNAYMKQLEGWCGSEYSHPAIRAVYAYLSGKTLIRDLVESKVLTVDENTGRLSDSKLNGIAQEDCFVRFAVRFEDGSEIKTWDSTELYNCFIGFNAGMMGSEALCYATGETAPLTYKHPSKLRNAGDKAKLISSNDESGFSYRGRFLDKSEAVSVSYVFSQKIHNALKWLIAKQGKNFGDLCVVAWESALQKLRQPVEKFTPEEEDDLFCDEMEYSSVPRNRELLLKSLIGTENRFSENSHTMIMALDSATPGRVALTMYSELSTSEYMENLAVWHSDTMWLRVGKNGTHPRSFSVYDIAECAYGTEQGGKLACDEKVRGELIQRLLPCISERRRISRDLVRALVAKACRPSSYEKKYNHQRVLECACGMLRKQTIEEKGECKMALDTECRSRDYLYGRLLAVADAAEESTYDRESSRTTNAKRFFEAFSNRPCRTWGVIYNHLRPYFARMPAGRRVYYERMIGEISEMFNREDFINNAPLKPEFLHAYSCQLNEIYRKKTDIKEDK